MSDAARDDMAYMSIEGRLDVWRRRALAAEEQTAALRAALAEEHDCVLQDHQVGEHDRAGCYVCKLIDP